MKLDRINPFIRYAKTHECFNVMKERSVCYDCRLFYIADGEGCIEIEGENREVGEGTLIYLPPRTVYRFDFRDAYSVKIRVINFDLVDTFSGKSSSLGTAKEGEVDLTRSPIYPIPCEFEKPVFLFGAEFAGETLGEITEAYLLKNDYYREICSAKLKLLLFELITRGACGEGEPEPALAIERYIKSNYHLHELDNGTISRAFNYHPYHASRLIKAHTGKTLHEYLVDFRLHIARNYLTTSRLSVTEIADRCGFSSYNHFIKCFRERTGVSPLKYRKEKSKSGL